MGVPSLSPLRPCACASPQVGASWSPTGLARLRTHSSRTSLWVYAPVRLKRGPLAAPSVMDGAVLLVKVVHVGYKIFDDIHVREWVDLGDFGRRVDFTNASQSIDSANVHGARAAYSLPARPPKG